MYSSDWNKQHGYFKSPQYNQSPFRLKLTPFLKVSKPPRLSKYLFGKLSLSKTSFYVYATYLPIYLEIYTYVYHCLLNIEQVMSISIPISIYLSIYLYMYINMHKYICTLFYVCILFYMFYVSCLISTLLEIFSIGNCNGI